MCLGIALVVSDVPTEMVGRCGLGQHLIVRNGKQPEFRLPYRDRRPRLPVIRDGHLFFVRWGNGRGQGRRLPRTGWTWLSTIRDGWWKRTGAIPVDIPASYGLDGRGVWYKVQVGVRGLLVPDERATPWPTSSASRRAITTRS